jgi:hypothetical protein
MVLREYAPMWDRPALAQPRPFENAEVARTSGRINEASLAVFYFFSDKTVAAGRCLLQQVCRPPWESVSPVEGEGMAGGWNLESTACRDYSSEIG